jgi:c-di-GMP-binding flagellar brake protein YcgR
MSVATFTATKQPTPTMLPASLPKLPPQSAGIRDRRRKPRIALQPMYTKVVVRALNEKSDPIDGHALDLSEIGLAIELDRLVPIGSPITIEFSVSGLGRLRGSDWPTFAAAGEVVRHANVEDFPQGPYLTGVRFVRIPSIVQGQIARYISARAIMATY